MTLIMVALAVPVTAKPDYATLLDFARRVAARIARRLPAHIDVQDLVSAAYVGLADAIQKHEALPAEEFAVLARCRMRGAIQDELRRHDVLPRRTRVMLRTMARAAHSHATKCGRDADERELAAATGFTPSECAELRTLSVVQHVSVDTRPGDAWGPEPATRPSMAPDAQAARRLDLAKVYDALPILSERERFIFTRVYVGGCSLREVAAELGVTDARVSQIHSRAVARLREQLEPAA